jgi:hypothetical protein
VGFPPALSVWFEEQGWQPVFPEYCEEAGWHLEIAFFELSFCRNPKIRCDLIR